MAYTTINKGSSYFNTVLYTGTGASNSVTGVGFKPDWVWIKRRGDVASHALFDINRGVNKQLRTNNTNAEEVVSWFPSFDIDGFTVSTTESDGNTSGGTYVAWNWLGSNTTTANTSGSISSTVSVNQTAGFSIVSWTGAGSAGTVGHGLGAVPKFIITKKRNNTGNWACYHSSLGNTQYIYLNSTNASATYSGFWNNTTPTSTLISLGTDDNVTGNGDNIIAYCFAEIKGYSKFGSYAGNNALTDGTFVYTGFSPSFVLVKRYGGGTQNWVIYDDKRNTYNVTNSTLRPNTTAAEATNNAVDLLSNGFKFRSNDGDSNGYSDGYIYAAFAENPFVTSTQIPTTAR